MVGIDWMYCETSTVLRSEAASCVPYCVRSTDVEAAPAAAAADWSVIHENIATPMTFMSPMVRFCFAFWKASSRFGISIETMIPMTATTMSSSINVNPLWPLCLMRKWQCITFPPRLPERAERDLGVGKTCANIANRKTHRYARGLRRRRLAAGAKKRPPLGQGLSVGRGGGVGADDPAHALDAAVELGQRQVLVGAVDAAGVVRAEREGSQAVRRHAALAEEARIGGAGVQHRHHRRLAAEHLADGAVQAPGRGRGGGRRRGHQDVHGQLRPERAANGGEERGAVG